MVAKNTRTRHLPAGGATAGVFNTKYKGLSFILLQAAAGEFKSPYLSQT